MLQMFPMGFRFSEYISHTISLSFLNTNLSKYSLVMLTALAGVLLDMKITFCSLEGFNILLFLFLQWCVLCIGPRAIWGRGTVCGEGNSWYETWTSQDCNDQESILLGVSSRKQWFEGRSCSRGAYNEIRKQWGWFAANIVLILVCTEALKFSCDVHRVPKCLQQHNLFLFV